MRAVLESSELDWRSNLDIPFRTIDLDNEIKEKIRKVTKRLGLQMGVFDLKLIEGSMSPVWLEINPQGQFLFVEGLTNLNLTKYFAKFLYNKAITNNKVNQATKHSHSSLHYISK